MKNPEREIEDFLKWAQSPEGLEEMVEKRQADVQRPHWWQRKPSAEVPRKDLERMLNDIRSFGVRAAGHLILDLIGLGCTGAPTVSPPSIKWLDPDVPY